MKQTSFAEEFQIIYAEPIITLTPLFKCSFTYLLSKKSQCGGWGGEKWIGGIKE